MPQWLTIGSGGLPISVNKSSSCFILHSDCLDSLNQVVHIGKVAPDSFSAVVHHMCEAMSLNMLSCKRQRPKEAEQNSLMEPVNCANSRQSWLTLLPGWQFQLCCSRQDMFSKEFLCYRLVYSKTSCQIHFCQ